MSVRSSLGLRLRLNYPMRRALLRDETWSARHNGKADEALAHRFITTTTHNNNTKQANHHRPWQPRPIQTSHLPMAAMLHAPCRWGPRVPISSDYSWSETVHAERHLLCCATTRMCSRPSSLPPLEWITETKWSRYVGTLM